MRRPAFLFGQWNLDVFEFVPLADEDEVLYGGGETERVGRTRVRSGFGTRLGDEGLEVG